MIEEQNQENRFPTNGIQLLPEGTELLHENDGYVEYLYGPNINAGQLGEIQLQLDRDADTKKEEEGREAYVFINGAITTEDRRKAEENGYSLIIRTSGSVVPPGHTFICNVWSETHGFVAISKAMRPREKGVANDLNFSEWSLNNGEARDFVVPGNEEFVSSLKFNIETILDTQQGGEEI